MRAAILRELGRHGICSIRSTITILKLENNDLSNGNAGLVEEWSVVIATLSQQIQSSGTAVRCLLHGAGMCLDLCHLVQYNQGCPTLTRTMPQTMVVCLGPT